MPESPVSTAERMPHASVTELRKFIHRMRVPGWLLAGEGMPTPKDQHAQDQGRLKSQLRARRLHERIAASLGLSKGVVTKYARFAAAAGLHCAPCNF